MKPYKTRFTLCLGYKRAQLAILEGVKCSLSRHVAKPSAKEKWTSTFNEYYTCCIRNYVFRSFRRSNVCFSASVYVYVYPSNQCTDMCNYRLLHSVIHIIKEYFAAGKTDEPLCV